LWRRHPTGRISSIGSRERPGAEEQEPLTMYGFCTLLDTYGNIVAECDETALDFGILAEASTVITEDGAVLSAESIILDFA
jgi:hypothetical protein